MVAIGFGGHLITGQRLTGMEGGRNFTQAFIRNVRDCLLMRRKLCQNSGKETEDPETAVGEFPFSSASVSLVLFSISI